MKKNYVKSSVKVREIDMQSLLTSSEQGNTISNGSATTGLDALGGSSPSNGGLNDGTHSPCARKNLWSEEEE